MTHAHPHIDRAVHQSRCRPLHWLGCDLLTALEFSLKFTVSCAVDGLCNIGCANTQCVVGIYALCINRGLGITVLRLCHYHQYCQCRCQRCDYQYVPYQPHTGHDVGGHATNRVSPWNVSWVYLELCTHGQGSRVLRITLINLP